MADPEQPQGEYSLVPEGGEAKTSSWHFTG